ncbi:FG-GAP repeat-containing protein [Nitzschia inconspicua]|uniref:FG-GAP repeat-containing protein n=1 Tax=Nitzschia inconspicua TaxID=303405 RepID=A0A9K3PQ44_9STRA|nr:FG-GAP repeat-containing protein [Nitzschia inconspicua]
MIVYSSRSSRKWTLSSLVGALTIASFMLFVTVVNGNPSSKPYIPFRTDPYDQPQCHHTLDLKSNGSAKNTKKMRIYEPDKDNQHFNDKCPLQFSLGVSRRTHDVAPGLGGLGNKKGSTSSPMGIEQPPVIYPILPWQGPGRQVLFTTQYEHLDMLTPSKGDIQVTDDSETGNEKSNNAAFSKSFIAEGMVEHVEFPLLFESSAFQTSPVLGDVNRDGILDAVLTDYHGGIYAIGLQVPRDSKRRYFHKAQVPRLFVRRQWMEAMVNETLGIDPYEAEKKAEAEEEARKAAEAAEKGESAPKDESKPIRARGERPHDPYHSYFEYTYGDGSSDHEPILRGVTADLLGQDQDHVEGLEERRKRRVSYERKVVYDSQEEEHNQEKVVYDSFEEEEKHQKVVYDSVEEEQKELKVVFDSVEEEKNHEKVVYDSVEEEQEKQKVVFDSVEEDKNQEKVVYDSVEEEQEVVFDSIEDEHNKEKVVYDSVEEEQKNEKVAYDSIEEEKRHEKEVFDSVEEDRKQEKIVYDSAEGLAIAEDLIEEMAESNHRRLQEAQDKDELETEQQIPDQLMDDGFFGGDDIYRGFNEEAEMLESIPGENGEKDETLQMDAADSEIPRAKKVSPVEFDDVYRQFNGEHLADDTYPRYDDHFRYDMYDDYYGGRYSSHHENYYDDKHYVRLPPHILCTPVLVEMPKLYSNIGELETLLFVAVSYYFDEDEYEGFFSYKRFENTDHGDETETQRGMYVANAIMIYQYGSSPRWGRQEHLDLSGDHSAPINTTLVGGIPLREDNSKLGAFAMSSPTVADIDGDGNLEVLLGTSMGFLYVMDGRNLFAKANWPVQLKYGIESRILVEDVRGDTNLEIFVSDVGGNVLCLDHNGNKIWHRDLLESIADGSEVLGSSPMTLGDVDGDGILDVVILLKVRSSGQSVSRYLFALRADTGVDLSSSEFPINIWTKKRPQTDGTVGEDFVHESLPPALLIDLHADQSHLSDYLKRNGTKWDKRNNAALSAGEKPPHGGRSGGLHIVQPVDTHLVIVEGGSGCVQSIEIGEDILSMVQADDVHGTNKLDLVVSTITGNVVTLESQAPYHPLNVWNGGELRSRTGGSAHGYSASQGIFVHEVSRQYRDIFGVYIPVTFEIFDNRPNIQNEPDKRKYKVEVREGTSRLLFVKEYSASGVYTERLFIASGPGYYELSVILTTTHGLVYEDAFHIGYNVNYMDGFGLLLWLPLTIATIAAFLMGSRKTHWEDDDFQGDNRNGKQGILGNLPD